ncbi:hypothetical protein [Persephonella sp.]
MLKFLISFLTAFGLIYFLIKKNDSKTENNENESLPEGDTKKLIKILTEYSKMKNKI